MGVGTRLLVDFSYLVGAAAYLPVLTYQAVRYGKHRSGWGERLGHLPRRGKTRPRIWIHAVSMGEVNATKGLVDALAARVPQAEFVITTTTDTGYDRAMRIYPDHAVHRYPLDFKWVVRRALDALQPDLIILIELEVWYNLVTQAADRGIPVCVVNGRLSARSASRFAWIAPVARDMFGAIAWAGTQDEEYARRFREAGVPADRVEVTSSLKWDTATITDQVDGTDALASAMGIDRTRRLWIGGSTGDQEEGMVLDAHQKLKERFPDLQLAIIPRKPERFDEVARLIVDRGFRVIRRTERRDGNGADGRSVGDGVQSRSQTGPGESRSQTGPGESRSQTAPTDEVFLGDTLGEIRKFYLLGDVVFVGRSLNGWGGSDPMEVAALQRPIVMGPHTQNFQDAVNRLKANNAMKTVYSPADLADGIGQCLEDSQAAAAMAQRARQTVIDNQGATERSADRLAGLLKARLQRTP